MNAFQKGLRTGALFFILMAVLILLPGCQSVLDGDTAVIEPYSTTQVVSPSSDSDTSPIINTYEEFSDALYNILAQGDTSASFRMPIVESSETVEEKISEICRETALDTPLGSYAVYYISYEITPIVSYNSIQVTVSYKRDTEDIQSLFTVASSRFLDSKLLSALTDYSSSIAFYTSSDDITSDYIESKVSSLYYENPLDVVMLPHIETTCSPSSSGDRIMEVSLSWDYNATVLADMQDRLISRVDAIVSREEDTGDADLIESFYQQLLNSANLQVSSENSLADTAYSILVSGSGTSRGFALAFKALCDRMNISCIVVDGWHNGELAYWDIVECDGQYYHIDPSYDSGSNSKPSLCSDSQFTELQYYWNSDSYPSCTSSFSSDKGGQQTAEDSPPAANQ